MSLHSLQGSEWIRTRHVLLQINTLIVLSAQEDQWLVYGVHGIEYSLIDKNAHFRMKQWRNQTFYLINS